LPGEQPPAGDRRLALNLLTSPKILFQSIQTTDQIARHKPLNFLVHIRSSITLHHNTLNRFATLWRGPAIPGAYYLKMQTATNIIRKENLVTRFTQMVVVAAVLIIATPAIAQDQSMANMPGMNMSNMGAMMGMHMMSATVTTIDSKNGLIDVTAGSMALKLHFPPASLAALRPGDKITLHLAFSKP
jgi:hypothetical protein